MPCHVATLFRHGCQRIGDRAFSAPAPIAWNKLPTELKLLRSTGSFRRGLKTIICSILSTGIRIRTDSVMRPRSSSRGRNRSASVTVIVTVHRTDGETNEVQFYRGMMHNNFLGR